MKIIPQGAKTSFSRNPNVATAMSCQSFLFGDSWLELLFTFYKESNEDEIFKLTEELEELKITNESLQKVRNVCSSRSLQN